MRVQFREIDLLAWRVRRDGSSARNFAGLWFTVLAVFCYGLLLPHGWTTCPLFGPIRWAALHVPMVGNYAEASPNPDFVQGFLGLMVSLRPFFGLYFFCKLNIERTEPGLITILMPPPTVPDYSRTPTFYRLHEPASPVSGCARPHV